MGLNVIFCSFHKWTSTLYKNEVKKLLYSTSAHYFSNVQQNFISQENDMAFNHSNFALFKLSDSEYGKYVQNAMGFSSSFYY